MKIIKTKFSDLKIIKLKKNKDTRGNLVETFRKKNFNKNNLIFDYKVFSKKNVIRGFHFQHKHQQAKQIIVLKGKILDCVIDLRKKSKTFGKSFKIFLSEKNNLSLYVPQGFAHSYLTLDNENIVYYKLSNYYYPKYESGIMWNDKDLNINWGTATPKLSGTDLEGIKFSEFNSPFNL